MKKALGLIMIVLVVCSLFSVLPVGASTPVGKGEHQSDDPEYSVGNEYLSLFVEYGWWDGIGTACLETSEGYDLLYTSRNHDAWSSYLTVQIDGVNYANSPYSPSLNNYVTQYPTVVGDSIVTKWSIGSIQIEQTIELVGKAAKWMFTISNTGTSNRQVKIRYLFDYQVRDQDGAPICIPEGPILKKETKYVGMEIDFDYWFTRDYLDSTYTVQGVHTLSTRPYMIIFANWAWAVDYLFDYAEFDPNRAFYTPSQIYSPQSDSCALIYWDLASINSGETKNVITYYGTGAPTPTGIDAVKYALDELESYVMGKIQTSYYNYALGMAKGYKKWGDWFKDNVINYYGYKAELIDESEVDVEVKRWADSIIGEHVNKTMANMHYELLGEMFSHVNLNMDENEIAEAFFNYLLGKAQPAIDYFKQTFSSQRNRILEELTLIQSELSEDDFKCLANAIKNIRESVFYPQQHESFLNMIGKATMEEIQGEVSMSLIGIHESPLIPLVIAGIVVVSVFVVGGIAGYYSSRYVGPGAVATYTCTAVTPPDYPERERFCKRVGTISGVIATSVGPSIAGGICIVAAPIGWVGIPFCVGFFIGWNVATIEGLYRAWSGSNISVDRVKEYVNEQTGAALQVLEHTASDITEPSDTSGNLGVGTSVIKVRNVGAVPVKPNVGPDDIIVEGAVVHTTIVSLPDELMPGEEAIIEYSYAVNLASIGSSSCAYYQSKVALRISDVKKIVTWSNFFKVCNMMNPGEREAIEDVSLSLVSEGSITEGETHETSFTTGTDTRRCVFSLSYASSDLDLHVYDEQGNHVGLNYFTGEIENQIEGAWYSGPNTYPELIEVSGDIGSRSYTIGVTAVTTDETGADYVVVSREVPQIRPIMKLSPKYIELTMKPTDSQTVSFCTSETGGISKLSNVALQATDLVCNEHKISSSNIQFSDNNFDVEAGSTVFVLMDTSIPEDAFPGTYTGKITATDESGATDESIINVTVLPPPDITPPTTTLFIGSPQYTDVTGKLYITSATEFALTAVDNNGAGSGVATTAYRIYNTTFNTGWITYTLPFNLSGFDDGAYTIDYNSTDNAGNVEPRNTATVILDNTGPSVTILNPPSGWALQDGVTFIASAIDSGSGVLSLNFSVREANDAEGVSVGFEDLPATYDATFDDWTLFFDTLLLPDGYYVVLAKAKDNLGNMGPSTIVPYSIRNWAVIELLPASGNNKAGRTMPVKFALRVVASVDPLEPFVYNEELMIKIYATKNPDEILQESTFGDTARDYRIDTADELYITNFKTLKTPMSYTVEIYRKEMLIGSFEFQTVK